MRKAKTEHLKKIVVNKDFDIYEPMERSTVVNTRLASNSSQFEEEQPSPTGSAPGSAPEQNGVVYAALEMHENKPPELPPKKKDIPTTNSKTAGGYRKKSRKNKRSRK